MPKYTESVEHIAGPLSLRKFAREYLEAGHIAEYRCGVVRNIVRNILVACPADIESLQFTTALALTVCTSPHSHPIVWVFPEPLVKGRLLQVNTHYYECTEVSPDGRAELIPLHGDCATLSQLINDVTVSYTYTTLRVHIGTSPEYNVLRLSKGAFKELPTYIPYGSHVRKIVMAQHYFRNGKTTDVYLAPTQE